MSQSTILKHNQPHNLHQLRCECQLATVMSEQK